MLFRCHAKVQVKKYQTSEFNLISCTDHRLKGKWQKKLLSHLKETLKQYIEVYYKISISLSLREIFSPKSTNRPPSWINF